MCLVRDIPRHRHHHRLRELGEEVFQDESLAVTLVAASLSLKLAVVTERVREAVDHMRDEQPIKKQTESNPRNKGANNIAHLHLPAFEVVLLPLPLHFLLAVEGRVLCRPSRCQDAQEAV